jgi:excisionase family DNA binding protein
MEPVIMLAPAEVAARLRVCIETVRRLTRAGVLPHVRIGRVIRYSESAITEWINKKQK